MAFVFAPDGGVTEQLGQAATTDEFLDRWRVPGGDHLTPVGGPLW